MPRKEFQLKDIFLVYWFKGNDSKCGKKGFKLKHIVYETDPSIQCWCLRGSTGGKPKNIKAENYLLLVIKCWSTSEGTQFNEVCISSAAKEGVFNHFSLLSDRSIHFPHLVSVPNQHCLLLTKHH